MSLSKLLYFLFLISLKSIPQIVCLPHLQHHRSQ